MELNSEPGKSALEKIVFLFELEFFSIMKYKNIGSRYCFFYFKIEKNLAQREKLVPYLSGSLIYFCRNRKVLN